MPNFYIKTGNHYYLCDHLRILIQSMTEVGLAFVEKVDGSVELAKYGSSDAVKAWYDSVQGVYSTDEVKLIMMHSSGWSENELNQLLSDVSYASIFYHHMLDKFKAQQKG